MKNFLKTSILLTFITIIPTVSSSTIFVCTYGSGAEIVVDTKDFNGHRIDLKRTSPQKMMTHKIHIDNKNTPDSSSDYLEVSTSKYTHTYALTCKKQQ